MVAILTNRSLDGSLLQVVLTLFLLTSFVDTILESSGSKFSKLVVDFRHGSIFGVS